MRDTQRSPIVSTKLRQIAEQAKGHPDRVFTSLIHLMDVEFLREAYHRLRRTGAPGLSGVNVKEYGRDLETNLADLYRRLREGRYKAPPIKRVWIDKEGGKKRPIGLPEIEDKVVQKAVSMLMGAVYEQDFRPYSYGFREGRSAHQALAEIRREGMDRGIRWIYDADIKGFFDNIDRGWLRRFIQQRINDGGVLKLIGKWLNAGVMEEGRMSYSERGTPQGGVISPVLANLFLHHVLDEWFEQQVKPRMRGHCFLVRFADDFVIGFQHEEDARRVMEVLPKRFEKHGLEIHPQKSRLIEFKVPSAVKRGGCRGNTFDFLGFTHYWARSRRNQWVIKRKTASKRLRGTVKSLWEWCKKSRHMELEQQHRILSAKLRGHFQYFGVRCNISSMESVRYHAIRGWRFWLNRRSRKKAMSWEKLHAYLARLPLPTPKIIHPI